MCVLCKRAWMGAEYLHVNYVYVYMYITLCKAALWHVHVLDVTHEQGDVHFHPMLHIHVHALTWISFLRIEVLYIYMYRLLLVFWLVNLLIHGIVLGLGLFDVFQYWCALHHNHLVGSPPTDQRRWRRVPTLLKPTGMMSLLKEYVYLCSNS